MSSLQRRMRDEGALWSAGAWWDDAARRDTRATLEIDTLVATSPPAVSHTGA